ncbi:MAG: hypothetical protein WAS26_10740 [Paracoccaceae bacterium]
MPSPDPKQVTLEWYRNNIQFTRELGLLALKTLITLNSGAFVVLLTFIGNSAAKTAFFVPLTALQISMYCFLGGITASFGVIAFAYINSIRMNPYDFEQGVRDGIAIPIYILGATLSLGLFVFGVFSIISNVALT